MVMTWCKQKVSKRCMQFMSYTKKHGYLYPDKTQVMIVEAKDNVPKSNHNQFKAGYT
jgi:hypothetical protein